MRDRFVGPLRDRWWGMATLTRVGILCLVVGALLVAAGVPYVGGFVVVIGALCLLFRSLTAYP